MYIYIYTLGYSLAVFTRILISQFLHIWCAYIHTYIYVYTHKLLLGLGGLRVQQDIRWYVGPMPRALAQEYALAPTSMYISIIKVSFGSRIFGCVSELAGA